MWLDGMWDVLSLLLFLASMVLDVSVLASFVTASGSAPPSPTFSPPPPSSCTLLFPLLIALFVITPLMLIGWTLLLRNNWLAVCGHYFAMIVRADGGLMEQVRD